MPAINSAKIHKLVLDVYCSQETTARRQTNATEYIISGRPYWRW